jgi:predicted permease
MPNDELKSTVQTVLKELGISTPSPKPPFTPELRLIGQFSVPVEEIIEGEELYRQLKEMLKNYSPNITLNGQVMKMLEPCCKDKVARASSP